MMTRAKLIKQWGTDSLVHIPDSLLDTINIPAESKEFLRQIGMPRKFCFIDGGMEFEALPIGPTPPQSLPATEHRMLQRFPGTPSLLLASADMPNYFFCVQEGDGTVGFASALPDEQIPPFCSINSNLPAWMECLLIYRSFIEPKGEDEDKLSGTTVRGFERRMERVDAHIFDEPAYFWSTVVEEIWNYVDYP